MNGRLDSFACISTFPGRLLYLLEISDRRTMWLVHSVFVFKKIRRLMEHDNSLKLYLNYEFDVD